MSDPVYRPPHYTRGSIETINVIEDWGLGFHLGNVIKYISRAGHKARDTEIEDLKKARWYLDRHIETLEQERAASACADCGGVDHKPDCPWRVIVPGKGE